ncbi:hypothetical protein Lfu02_57340 [Longispora fulva]|uniref:Uncharacterized protein n=1 Tax=Longispora fulva TaxID=619741 RepID=A0A8J7GIM8_9ACTN|nr:hypothetical protein [Longispora fulva]MBG6137285.1 hypothetical protein [Longispora fulva]GIG61362.1 hypothetical protein Lfu02_57340 [Longispora fulva]
MSAPVYFATIGLFLGTILAIFAMRYRAVTSSARAAQAASLDVAAVQASLDDIAARLGTIEKTLKEIE